MIYTLKSYRQSLLQVLIPVLLATTVGLIFVYISSNGELGSVSGIIFILVGLYPFVRAWVRKDFDAFEIINVFVLYMLLGIGLRGLVGIKYGSLFLFYDPNSEHFDILSFKVFIYSTIALLSLYLGYYSRLGNRWLNVLPRLNFDWRKTRVVGCLVIYFVIYEGALILYTIKFGNWEGIHSFGEKPGALSAKAVEGGRTHISAFFYFFGVILDVSCIYIFSKKRPIWAIITAWFCLLQTLITFLHYGGKGTVVLTIMAYVLSRHYLKKMVSLRMFVVIIAGIFILSPFLWHVRDYSIYQWDILKYTYISAINNPVEFLLPIVKRAYEFDSFALFIDAIEYSGKGLELGATMTFLFYFFIPRIWWPEKPTTFSVVFPSKYTGMDLYGSCWAPGLPGELYVNFHLIGIILGFLLVGILMKLCYQCLIKRNHNKSSLLIYLPIVLNAPFFFEAGTLRIADYLIMLFPVILFLWFVRAKNRKM